MAEEVKPSKTPTQRGLFSAPSERVIPAPPILTRPAEPVEGEAADPAALKKDPSLAFLTGAALARDPSLAGGLTARKNQDKGLQKEQSKSYFNIKSSLADQDKSFFDKQGGKLGGSLINENAAPAVVSNNQIGGFGDVWRACLRGLMSSQYSRTNGLQMSRILQLFLPFQTGLEALLLYRLIEAFDKNDKNEIKKHLKACFQNRNVSRIIVQQLSPRFDWLWHIHTWMTNNRVMDGFGQLPVIGITGFPATENFPATRNFAIASIFRRLLGEGNFITRVATQGREGLVTDDPNAAAQNLAAESNSFESSNISQYGTTYGRNKTNDFRFHHRLPTDESLVRTFISSPQTTSVNNGVMHMLWGLARHWRNMIYQPWGNFAHQRMEQLDPFEIMRFHMPQMLLVITNLRGRNRWDAEVLGPFIRDLQHLTPSANAAEPVKAAQTLALVLKDMLPNVCAGVPAWLEPFETWVDAIITAFDEIQNEAVVVSEILFSVETGIRVGFDVMTATNWTIASDDILKKSILHHVREIKKCEENPSYRPKQLDASVPMGRITSALNLTTPRDKRTFIELVTNGLENSSPAQLLLGRVKTLLQRELRRHNLNLCIRERSIGDAVTGDLNRDEWYWIDDEVYCCLKPLEGKDKYLMMHVASNIESEMDVTAKDIKKYNYVAESINRAQKAYMSIELYHGRTFIYNAFAEFPSMRTALLRLQVVGQMACEELDNARLNVLREVQRSRAKTAVNPKDLEVGKQYFIYDDVTEAYKPFVYQESSKISSRARIVRERPQSLAVVGGGPTGLCTVLHCTENCLASDGVMKLFEARDAFLKGGSTFERAQIVRLDARWIAMMRYHCGTSFEDVYIPLVGETDSQLGNTLPDQGFVEITIKDLEGMLHGEVTRLWSKGLVQIYTESKSGYDADRNQVLKEGVALKPGDLILRDDGQENSVTWRVTDVIYSQSIPTADLKLGDEYNVWVPAVRALKPFRLTRIDLEGEMKFKSLEEGIEDIISERDSPPSCYPKGTPSSAHGTVTHIKMQCTKVGEDGTVPEVETVDIESIKKKKFALDVGYTHVFEAIGKPKASKKHIRVTTAEPYGVACLQGLKVSYGMHSFGVQRFGGGLQDDFRSVNDQNTRIIGDFTKMVRVTTYMTEMNTIFNTDKDWPKMFEKVINDSKFPELNNWDPIVPKLKKAIAELAADAPNWRRKTVQTRFFETGDNYYLGMEFTREYDLWKNTISEELVATLRAKDSEGKQSRDIDRLKGTLQAFIDKLRYDGVLEAIRKGDVYNPGARRRVPRLYLIDSLTPQKLSTLDELESFRFVKNPKELWELILRTGGKQVCRSVEGKVKIFMGNEMIRRESNLTRGPDGNAESRVSIAAFPVGHYVNHRSMVPLQEGHVIAFGGDEQSTPHFMRYSGLTGACINAMSFNIFIGKAIIGVDFQTRYREYSQETNWSNGEVVQRGTGANYGEDGFLRPGFPYRDGVNYIRDKLVEYRETDTPEGTTQDHTNPMSYDWKVKFAAALVPRGLEHNRQFLDALKQEWHNAIFARFIEELNSDPNVTEETIESVNVSNDDATKKEDFWASMEETGDSGWYCKRVYECINSIIEFAQWLRSKDLRISTALFHQLKPVDHIVDDFSVDAQAVANALTLSASLSASALALSLVGERSADASAATLAGVNILVSFGTMANISRYKTRNEESRTAFFYDKYLGIMQSVFSVMSEAKQLATPNEQNPFFRELNEKADILKDQLKYYNIKHAEDFDVAYNELVGSRFAKDAVQSFQSRVLTEFCASKYAENSYIQESLVNIYDVTNRILTLERIGSTGEEAAEELFTKLTQLEPRLENSLQQGVIRFGYLRKRKFTQWDICAVFAYIRGFFYFHGAERKIGSAPVEVETAYLSKKVRELSAANGDKILKREFINLETCFWAHRESLIASCVFVAGFLVFIASILFTISRIFDIDVLRDAAFYAALPSSLGALLAAWHLFRKTFILLGLLGKVKAKKRAAAQDAETNANFNVVISATVHQIMLTILRFLAAFSAAGALPYAVAENEKDREDEARGDIPAWIAVGSAGTAALSVIYFLGVEYVVRYNLPVDLGPFVCRMFEAEIRDAYEKTAGPESVIQTPKKNERDHWEFAARVFLHEYRFDSVFAADRFGQILQTIQGGLDDNTKGV